MNQVDQIKELQRQGVGPKEIGERLSLNRKTVAKYMAREVFDAVGPDKVELPSKIAPYKDKIDEWLEEDRRMRFKQRHTAKRVHERLKEEFGDAFTCSYSIVQRYLKTRRAKRLLPGSLELVWAPGEAQGDFGEADVISEGVAVTIKYLVLSFPASNAVYVQAFRGETAECVAQGLRDIFHHIGGVPLRIVFDNASGIGGVSARRSRCRTCFCGSSATMGSLSASATRRRGTRRATSRTRSDMCGATSSSQFLRWRTFRHGMENY